MLQIGLKPITFSDVTAVAQHHLPVQLHSKTLSKLKKARQAVEDIITNKQIVYGVTTGFGAFKNTFISADDVATLQLNLILSHAVGVGRPFAEPIVRGIMFLIANYLSKGHSGARPVVVETLINMLNKNVVPVVPEKGSVGSSGDLAPSAHVILVLIGHGQATYKGTVYPGAEAMKKAGIQPITLAAKEGLALINNTATMSSNAAAALSMATELVALADVAGALSAEALRATPRAFDKRIHDLKPHQGQISVASHLRSLLKGSTMTDSARVQDQYSLRCMPQIHGAVREAIRYVESVVNTELNSVTDNPLIFAEKEGTDVISGGNFHGEPVAIAMDTLGIALSELANVSDRRTASLMDPATNNGLPAFLAKQGGLNSGMMILQYTTAALVSENKVLAHPASVDSIPTSANVEDLVSMGTIAARKALEIARNVRSVLVIELLVACQAIDFRREKGFKLAPKTAAAYSLLRKVVPFFEKDTEYHPYFARIEEIIPKLITILLK